MHSIQGKATEAQHQNSNEGLHGTRPTLSVRHGSRRPNLMLPKTLAFVECNLIRPCFAFRFAGSV